MCEIKVVPCPSRCHKRLSHHCLTIENCTIKEDIYLYEDCDENKAELVILHESIHAILYHLLDEEKLRNLLSKLISDKVDLSEIDISDYLKEELISSKYDNKSQLCVPSENWFSSLLEDWNSENWFAVNELMKIRSKK